MTSCPAPSIEPGPCKRCGGRIILFGDRAWCAKPSENGGCGGHFREVEGRWKRTGQGKVGRINPIVKEKGVKR